MSLPALRAFSGNRTYGRVQNSPHGVRSLLRANRVPGLLWASRALRGNAVASDAIVLPLAVFPGRCRGVQLAASVGLDVSLYLTVSPLLGMNLMQTLFRFP